MMTTTKHGRLAPSSEDCDTPSRRRRSRSTRGRAGLLQLLETAYDLKTTRPRCRRLSRLMTGDREHGRHVVSARGLIAIPRRASRRRR